MEKLLHERLREYADNASISRISIGKNTFNTIGSTLARDLAAEIERYYIPRPRFEDGEPARTGDPALTLTGEEGEVYKLISDYPGEHATPNYSCAVVIYGEGAECEVPSGMLKRPTPKVLDADGVEIKSDDVVYDENGDNFIVLKPDAFGSVLVLRGRNGKELTCKPDTLIHERPVFDVNGERIRKGDTVWDKASGEQLTVVEFVNRQFGLVQCSNEDGDCEDHNGHQLTHREPDTFEKVRDFARANAFKIQDGRVIKQIADRLTAIIERNA